jgi:hypothetical protein
VSIIAAETEANLCSRVEGRRPVSPFVYRHRGSLATIGRKAAVAHFGRIMLSGSPAWWLWGVVHIGFMVLTRPFSASRRAIKATPMSRYCSSVSGSDLIIHFKRHLGSELTVVTGAHPVSGEGSLAWAITPFASRHQRNRVLTSLIF